MRVCENCGAQADDDILQIRCPKCGAKYREAETVADANAGEIHAEPYVKIRDKKIGAGRIAALCAVLIVVIMFALIWVQREAKAKELYGEWVTENGALSLTFNEDGTLRIGAGSALLGLGADLFEYEKTDSGTLKLTVSANGLITGIVGEITDMVSLELDYEVDGDELYIELLGTEYTLYKKD